MRLMVDRQLAIPRHDRFHEVCWRRPTVASVTTILKNPAYAGAFVYGRKRMKCRPSNRPPTESAEVNF